ncbi:DUF1441 family protein [Dechloromonas sp. TW-R-39-2]|uniref:DUF1441 family protein n=1 Tax=Dechloromonas sp. TW-R-39-2 TaxID=2654218 RepID=UPI00193CC999|nr:DUF1441 family protein [Dechloromonas sp. TW-R-39-2]QRM19713.1 DUF1441 family protein [Dechloromonas sp. TW-R-39-2]
MNNSTTFSELPAMSIRGLSQLLDIDRDTVRSTIERAGIQPSSRRGGYPAYALRDALRAMFSRRGADLDPATLSPADRKNLADAKLKEQQLHIRTGEYMLRDAYKNATATAYATCAQAILSLPDNLERKCGLSSDQVETVENIVTNILDTLYSDMKRAHETATE